MFGSFETKLYLPSSDLDLVIFCDDQSAKANLQTLAQALVKADLVYDNDVQVIAARVPILKFTDRLGQFSIDVSFHMDNGVRAAERLQQLQSQMPALR